MLQKMRAATVGLGAGLVGMVLLGAGVALETAPPFAEQSKSGKSLVVPSDLASEGTVYHVITGRDRQIHFTSDAPLEKIKGQSNKVIGFAVSGPSSNPASLAGGEWQLPVESMKTGIDLRDEHMASEAWLDSEAFPLIVFQLDRVEGIEQTRAGSGFKSYTGTLVGEMTLHGVTQPISIEDASLTFLAESTKTQKIAKGDLLAIRVKYSVLLSDYGVDHPVIGDKVSNEVELSTTLYLSTQLSE